MTRAFFLILVLLAAPAWAESSITTAFSPHAGATEAVVGVIQSAEHTVHLAGYGFTSKPIAQALVAAHQRGIDVELVLDKSNTTAKYTAATEVAQAGVPVRIDSKYAIMHNKFMVIDGATVETGSFNYTTNAEAHNAENVLVLREYPAVATQYEARWQMLWNESDPFSPQP